MNGTNKIILPKQKCVHCGNPYACLEHSPVLFQKTDGTVLKFDNVGVVLATLMAEIDKLKTKLGTQAVIQ